MSFIYILKDVYFKVVNSEGVIELMPNEFEHIINALCYRSETNVSKSKEELSDILHVDTNNLIKLYIHDDAIPYYVYNSEFQFKPLDMNDFSCIFTALKNGIQTDDFEKEVEFQSDKEYLEKIVEQVNNEINNGKISKDMAIYRVYELLGISGFNKANCVWNLEGGKELV